MGSDVYFANLRARSKGENKVSKIKRLFDEAGFKDFISENDLTAIKIHFGEEGNDSYINPVYARQIVDKIKDCKGKPFLTDTNTLYSGSRSNAVDHLITAIEHGFNFSVLGAPVIIADGLNSKNSIEVEINKKHFNRVKIAGDIYESNSMIVMSHFKGHELAGFGGSIKNLAMGCAPAAGKQQQHSTVKPEIFAKKCMGCRRCYNVCPVKAISMIDKKAGINAEFCIGCGECVTVCGSLAIRPNWGTDVTSFLERMTEYALGAVKNKQNKVGYINFLINITPDCDCVPWSDSPIVPDIGILASKDPVAIDRASLDLINKQSGFENSLLKCNHEHGKDKFTGIRDDVDGYRQIIYGDEIGLGSKDYNLIEI